MFGLTCLKEPIPQIFDAARYLDAAVSAHAAGNSRLAEELIREADMSAISSWSESLWGAGGPWTRPRVIEGAPPFLPKDQRVAVRMPPATVLNELIARDGHRCRFCGIPLIRAEVRSLIRAAYPSALRWGSRNQDQHAAFQAMWLQFDHVLPHARGGDNDLSNIVVTCAPCNNGRSNLTVDEAGLEDPRSRPVVPTDWDGLERFRVIAP